MSRIVRYLRNPERGWRADLAEGLALGGIIGVAAAFDRNHPLWRELGLWITVWVAYTLIRGWLRRRKAVSTRSS